jgi:multisubunit Na+/H+ antiporter MnhE subunit
MMLVLVIAILTGVYALAVGSLAWEDLALGFALSSIFLWLFHSVRWRHHTESWRQSVKTLIEIPRYIAMLAKEILTGTWQVTTYVVGFRKLTHPGIIKIHFVEESQVRLGIGLLTMTLSPGSFLVDVNMEERFVLVHFIDISDPDRLREDIKRTFLRVPGSRTQYEKESEHA